MLLADAAQAVDGKLYILGGGWSVIGPEPSPMAIAIKIEVPWSETNQPHPWHLQLVDGDGQPVMAQTPEGERPVVVGGQFEVGRPAGIVPGTPIDVPMAIGLGALPLPAGRRLVWQLFIDGETQLEWQAAFSTRPAPAG
jgi:hypothetical protein